MCRKWYGLLALFALFATASYAAATTLEVVDRFGTPVTDTEIALAVFGSDKVDLGRSVTGTFEIDVEPGSSMIVLPIDTVEYDPAEVTVPANLGSTLKVTLPPGVRAVCADAAPVDVPSMTPFDTAGAGTSDRDRECGDDILFDSEAKTLWYVLTGNGARLSAETCYPPAKGGDDDDDDDATRLGVFCNGCEEATCIDANETACNGRRSRVEWDSVPGAEYLIALTDRGEGPASGLLTIESVGEVEEPIDCRAPRGACCLTGNGTFDTRGEDEEEECIVVTAEECEGLGGEYLGDRTDCIEPTGEERNFIDQPNLPIPEPDPVRQPVLEVAIDVPDSFLISDLDVDFVTDHTWLGELVIFLRGPDGTEITLTEGLCGRVEGADVVFDDEGTDFDCSAPATGSAPPEEPLGEFDGRDAQGTWTLIVEDRAPGDRGNLLQWSLHFDVGASPCVGACCTDGPGIHSDCIEVAQDECEADGGLFVGGSCDDIEDCVPLFVEFDSMSATQVADGVAVRWVTSIEMETVGFRVLRESGGRTKTISQVGSVVDAAGNGLTGASYEVVDREAGDGPIRYFLEDIDVRGRVTRHGPIPVERPGRVRGARTARGER